MDDDSTMLQGALDIEFRAKPRHMSGQPTAALMIDLAELNAPESPHRFSRKSLQGQNEVEESIFVTPAVIYSALAAHPICTDPNYNQLHGKRPNHQAHQTADWLAPGGLD